MLFVLCSIDRLIPCKHKKTWQFRVLWKKIKRVRCISKEQARRTLADRAYFLEKEDQILIRLGLSKVQAKIYSTLLRMKSGSSATIAQASTITRQQIYREMPIMVDLGLVEKIVGSPTKYQATPIETSLKILQSKKAAELSDLDQATKLFLENYASIKRNQTLEETSHFVYASEKEIALNKYEKECSKRTN